MSKRYLKSFLSYLSCTSFPKLGYLNKKNLNSILAFSINFTSVQVQLKVYELVSSTELKYLFRNNKIFFITY